MQKAKVYDLKKRAFLLSIEAIKFLRQLDKDLVSQTIAKQLLRSTTSIGANIVEAQAAPSKKDFGNFYNIALKSANESKYWLLLLKYTCQVKTDSADILIAEIDELAKIIAKSLLTMRGK